MEDWSSGYLGETSRVFVAKGVVLYDNPNDSSIIEPSFLGASSDITRLPLLRFLVLSKSSMQPRATTISPPNRIYLTSGIRSN